MTSRSLPKSVAELLVPIDDAIEASIEPLVDLMRQHGFITVSSCEGHFRPGDFRTARPNVVFSSLDRGLLHSWIREVSKHASPLPVHFYMFPVWDPDRDVVHEDNWMVSLDVSRCETHEVAEQLRAEALRHLRLALQRAASSRPLATDTFVRSRW